ncbi:MAG: cytidylate kinase-like family protein [Lachnospiraceae bacterium]|nr:cytidylate kinase-like family protein [Lachnospiraceae bacterium]MCI7595787.1 cytidylate kinase-like family protein [Lachnospiraceae bacterium]MDD7050442.1 cytidylate kinase-like family protein [Lachnospiraceae bacterium]MDY3221910.1 cytidylate kinase-like family protein [Lachnospiraceae bacterium]MDY4095994.1 cytidylate kinase-like family protein [Lachnospiraceae bacterium]
MAKKCIVTIGREYGSGGREIGEKLAEKLGFSFYDRNLLGLVSEQSGVSEDSLSERDERLERHHFPYRIETMSEELFHLQSNIMLKKAREESCVIVGRCSDIVLKDFANTVHIFIYADEEDRIVRIRERNNLDEVKARKLMKQTEKIRRSYYQYYTDCEWGTRENKDLLINSSKTGIEGSVEVIIAYLKIRGLIEDK